MKTINWIKLSDKKPLRHEGITILAKWLMGYVRPFDNENYCYRVKNYYRLLTYDKDLGWLTEDADGIGEEFDCWMEIKQ